MLSIGKGELRAGSELPAQRELAEGFGATNSPFFAFDSDVPCAYKQRSTMYFLIDSHLARKQAADSIHAIKYLFKRLVRINFAPG